MSSTLIPWRLCEVESYRYRTIGVLTWNRYDRHFAHAMDTIRREGVFENADGFRRVTAPTGNCYRRYVTPDEIDWTGLDEALAARKAA